nr:hypothetical protein [Tanacetum cinerariifolium]
MGNYPFCDESGQVQEEGDADSNSEIHLFDLAIGEGWNLSLRSFGSGRVGEFERRLRQERERDKSDYV